MINLFLIKESKENTKTPKDTRCAGTDFLVRGEPAVHGHSFIRPGDTSSAQCSRRAAPVLWSSSIFSLRIPACWHLDTVEEAIWGLETCKLKRKGRLKLSGIENWPKVHCPLTVMDKAKWPYPSTLAWTLRVLSSPPCSDSSIQLLRWPRTPQNSAYSKCILECVLKEMLEIGFLWILEIK